MTATTLEDCDCARGVETCGDVCACCDSPYTEATCACDCVARKLAAIFDVALADPEAFEAAEHKEKWNEEFERCLDFELGRPPAPQQARVNYEVATSLSNTALVTAWEALLRNPTIATNFWITAAPPATPWRILGTSTGD